MRRSLGRALVCIALAATTIGAGSFDVSAGPPMPIAAAVHAAVVASPDGSDTAEERQALSEDEGWSVNGLAVAVLLLAAFGAGLAWIKSQRDSGKTSKFPRIG